MLKVATAIIIDHFAGRTVPTIDDDDLRVKVRAGTISEADASYQHIGRNVARHVLSDLGLIKPTAAQRP